MTHAVPINIFLSLNYPQSWGNGIHSDVERINRSMNVPTKYGKLCDIIQKDLLKAFVKTENTNFF